jgi:hypothetical protein
MSLKITVTDVETGETGTAEITEGDYLLITHKPCYEHGVQVYANGTQVITVKGYRPRAKAVVNHPPSKDGE